MLEQILIGGLDTETTGLLNPDHRFVELYTTLRRDRKEVFKFEQRIDPQRSIGAEAQRVHGISATDLVGKPTWNAVAPAQHKVMCKADLIVIHNAEFDWNFLKQEFARVKMPMPDIPVFCTMENGVWATPNGKKPRLEELCFACEIDYDKKLAHAAHYDVDKMMDCFYAGLDWGFFQIPQIDLDKIRSRREAK